MSTRPDPVHVGAVGAGRMGRGIGLAFALAGQPCAIIDVKRRDDKAFRALAADATQELRDCLQTLARLCIIDADAVDDILQRIHIVGRENAPATLSGLQLVFEGVPETLEAKREALAYACSCLGDDAIIASTSSTMLSSELANLVTRPERFLNAHWLNPAYLIPLVEVSPHPGTAPDVVERLKAVLEAIGKIPVLCNAQPGYIVPRLQTLIMNEAARMVEQGVATAEDIDKATRYGFGIRYAAMGVVEFIDFGGADILYYASRYLSEALDESRYAAPAILEQKMLSGDIGLKSGRGFYDWRVRDVSRYREEAFNALVDLLRLKNALPPDGRPREPLFRHRQ